MSSLWRYKQSCILILGHPDGKKLWQHEARTTTLEAQLKLPMPGHDPRALGSTVFPRLHRRLVRQPGQDCFGSLAEPANEHVRSGSRYQGTFAKTRCRYVHSASNRSQFKKLWPFSLTDERALQRAALFCSAAEHVRG